MANLSEVDNRVTVDSLQTAIGYEYLRTAALSLEDGGTNQISKQRGFQFVNPTDDWFPGKLLTILQTVHIVPFDQKYIFYYS